jgi:hypothetical protein
MMIMCTIGGLQMVDASQHLRLRDYIGAGGKFYFSPKSSRTIKYGNMRWVEHLARFGKLKNTCITERKKEYVKVRSAMLR